MGQFFVNLALSNQITAMRDMAIKTLRPPIPTIIDENAVSSAELFQNRTLRPILKLQNELLIAIFKQYIIKRKDTFHKLNKVKKLEYIEHSIRKDLRFKNLLVGTIMGHFTNEEYKQFLANEKELTKRTTDLLVQRLTSQVEMFAT
ncbi:MAG: glyoxalase [Bacteroidota bacterium]